VLATANVDKSREILEILSGGGLDIELVPRPGDVADVVESSATLHDNARLKAIAICDATGLPALADDTGLVVDELGGAPGVHSARYAGEDASYADNVKKLLGELAGVPAQRRTARFTTVAIARFPDGREVSAVGTVEGTIADVPRGREGFGYDPVFVPDAGDGRTFAEMTSAEKHDLSHRGRAFRTLAMKLRALA
jgi:XTP/dITP diphosphohydrolase